MNDFIKVLINRDELTETNARKEFQWVQELLNSGELDYTELEEFLMIEFDLEPDYVLDFC